MTIEELRVEAEKLGYKLKKIEKYDRFKPCVCGHNRRSTIYAGGGIYYECKICGLQSPPGKSEKEAKLRWNDLITKYAENS